MEASETDALRGAVVRAEAAIGAVVDLTVVEAGLVFAPPVKVGISLVEGERVEESIVQASPQGQGPQQRRGRSKPRVRMSRRATIRHRFLCSF